MKNSKGLKVILFCLGLVLLVLGTWRLTMPVEFYAHHNLDLGSDPSMISEARGAGGVVVGFGVVILLGALFASLRFTSTIAAVVVFLSYGFARLLSIALDGMPGEVTLQGIVFEFIFGLLGVFALLTFRTKAEK
jgi:hypothetical protein